MRTTIDADFDILRERMGFGSTRKPVRIDPTRTAQAKRATIIRKQQRAAKVGAARKAYR